MKPTPLLVIALAISAAIALWGIIDPTGLGAISASIVATQFDSRGWFIMLEASGLLFVAIYLACGVIGDILFLSLREIQECRWGDGSIKRSILWMI